MLTDVSLDRLNELFTYHNDGYLVWNVDRYARKVKGSKAGWESKSKDHQTSYINIRIDGKLYKAHRVIWFMNYGYWPDYIDHIDGDGTNNRIENLRNVSMPENMKNRPRQKNNTSGVSGVCFINRFGKWKASISIDGKKKTIGYYVNFDDAVKARLIYERKLNYHKNHGRG